MAERREPGRRAGRLIGIGAGLAAALALLWLLPAAGISPEARRVAAILALVVVWWVTEALPLPVTAGVGAALCVAAGAADAALVFRALTDPVIAVLAGGLLLARAMAVQGLDQRLAYGILDHPWVAGSPRRALAALGLSAWCLAMWVGITACVALLCPVALAAARAADRRDLPGGEEAASGPLLFLVYAASAGAIATPIGTPPNLIGLALIRSQLGWSVGFFEWMLFAVPVSAALLAVRLALILRLFPPPPFAGGAEYRFVHRADRAAGRWTTGQRSVAAALTAAAAGWLAPGMAASALGRAHPAAAWLAAPQMPGIVALALIALLLVLPADPAAGGRALPWRHALRIDWGTMLLFGGGLLFGQLMIETGLSSALAGMLGAAAGSDGLLLGGVIGLTVVLSELASNTAAAAMVIPVAVALAGSRPDVALQLGLAATLAASQGFMLAVSTPGNAIVRATGLVRPAQMLRAGALVDAVSMLVLWAAVQRLPPWWQAG